MIVYVGREDDDVIIIYQSSSRPCIFPLSAEMSQGHYTDHKTFKYIHKNPRPVFGKQSFSSRHRQASPAKIHTSSPTLKSIWPQRGHDSCPQSSVYCTHPSSKIQFSKIDAESDRSIFLPNYDNI